jgi:hypothetical protein
VYLAVSVAVFVFFGRISLLLVKDDSEHLKKYCLAINVAEREGFEPSWEYKLPIRFRVGAVMTASVPLLYGERLYLLYAFNPGGRMLTSSTTRG